MKPEYQLRSQRGRVVCSFDNVDRARARLAEMQGRGLRLFKVEHVEREMVA